MAAASQSSMPTAPPGALRTIRGTQPGLLDPSQPSRLLRFPDANLHFASFDPKTALVDGQEPDMRKLNITDILPPPKRVVIESTPKGASFWRFVPRARLEEGAQDEGFWPRLIVLNGEQVHCYQEQWEIYKLDPAYRCTVFGGNKLSSITRVSLEDPSSSALDPSGVKRSRSTSPDPAPQKRVRSCYAQSNTSDDSAGIEDSEEDEIEDMLVDEEDGSEMPKLTSNRKFGRWVDRELLNAERQWRWRMNRVVQDKYNPVPPLPTEASFSMQDDRSDSSVSAPTACSMKRKGTIAPQDIDGAVGSEDRSVDENALSKKRMRAISSEGTRHTTSHGYIMRERKRFQKITKFRQRRQPGHHLHFGDNLHFGFSPSVDENDSEDTNESDCEQTREGAADNTYDPEAARQAEIAQSIRKMRELEKDRPLWEEQKRLREARELAEQEERRSKVEQQRRAEEQRKLQEQEAIEQERRRAAAEAERRARDEELRHRENRKRRQRERWDSGPWTPIRALERYKMLSEEFDDWKFSPDESIAFHDIPWPVLHAPSGLTVEDVDWSAVEAFFDAVKSHMRLQDYKAFVEKSHRRFHPDRWRARNVWLAVRDDVDRGFMEVAANTVAQAITPIWRGLKAHDAHSFQS